MKTVIVFFLLLYSLDFLAQPMPDSVKMDNNIIFSTDSIRPLVDTVDTRHRNAYGDLLNDDPLYSRRYSVGLVLARVTSSNVF